jgi:hypothetical protein
MTRKRSRAKPAAADAAVVEPAADAAVVEPAVVEAAAVEPAVVEAPGATTPSPAAPAPVPAAANPPAGALVAWIRARLLPAVGALARRIGIVAVAAWRRMGPVLRRIAAGARATAGRVWARLDSRGRIAVLGGAGALVVLIVVAVSLRPGGTAPPSESQPTGAPTSAAIQPTLSPSDVAALLGNVLPTPTTTDTVLLVTDAASLSASEQAWLSDLRGRLGNVDPVAYRDVTLERLREYFVVFVIDRSDALDPAVLAAAHEAGLAIHLIGPAAVYRAQVAGVAQ